MMVSSQRDRVANKFNLRAPFLCITKYYTLHIALELRLNVKWFNGDGNYQLL